ncbi:probable carboxylesterase 17 [Beta vulgaris subsp. vulgaris]|uniref:probable carboxylesterase 17 n=1 Tax=Beta vulgaris subsp. vulgaris TaxID=3555 RepID=UPI000540295A|nr:probable carboxylesterase 17 [Beta vulgaris subsp. vulgaris]
MASLSLNPRLGPNTGRDHHHHRALVEEIQGLIKVYKDGNVERFPIIKNVPCSIPSELRVTSSDIVIDRFTNLWARLYVPHAQMKLPLLVYFHGGGFCVGSAEWSCYHDFISNLASKAGCVVLSVNYRLAPENRLPAAYEDGYNTIMWVKKQAANSSGEHSWWLSRCNLSGFFLAGDSAGANIAHNVALRFGASKAERSNITRPLCHRGTILIQPFFGGEARTASEKAPQPQGSALTLSAADTYWRLSLPVGSNREHPWCNPLADGAAKLKSIELPATMVCVSDMDILMDRNKEFCSAMVNAGKTVKMVVYKGVGHAFQILHNSPLSRTRTQEMMPQVKAFINN